MTNAKLKAPAGRRDHEAPPDNTLPGATGLLDLTAIMPTIESEASVVGVRIISCDIAYVRFEPGHSLEVVMNVAYEKAGPQETGQTMLYAITYSPRDYELQCASVDKSGFLSGILSSGFVAIPECYILLYEFPNDRALPYLRNIASASKLEALLNENTTELSTAKPLIFDTANTLSTISYKPERKAIMLLNLSNSTEDGAIHNSSKCGPFDACVRIERARKTCDTARISRILRLQLNSDISFPEVLFEDRKKGIKIIELAPGETFSKKLRGSNLEASLARVSRSLARLHMVSSPLLPSVSLKARLSKVQDWAEFLQYAGEEAQARVASLVENFFRKADSLLDQDATFVHGDFHPGQIILDDERIWILDLERSHIGDPINDIGCILAHLELRSMRGKLPDDNRLRELFLGEYSKIRSVPLPSERINIWSAFWMLHLATKPLRRLKKNWKSQTLDLLSKCDNLLNGEESSHG
ncbi:MAG: aminoglycoside phosphotransferase family protein [candidate division Zixibacteria bacterium]|nr:aminoglycoside phosphotransferase family protein [candidate division Zixibacteria bacterium]